MKRLASALSALLAVFAALELCALPSAVSPVHASHGAGAPRKIVLASALVELRGAPDVRVARACALVDQAVEEARREYGDSGLDLIVFPEFSLLREDGTDASGQALSPEGPELRPLREKAREQHVWIVMPMVLEELSPEVRYSNAAVLFDRAGAVAGVYRKVHPIPDTKGGFEGGVRPGEGYPVFNCDFGRIGILICWDMAYEQSWDALSRAGAELVVLPSASPQNARPAAQALRHHYYVLNSAPRDNATLFSPLGTVLAQTTEPGSVLVRQIDLSYAILHWSETLREGRLFDERYGSRAGHVYSRREDTGLFWSNDPGLPIGAMLRELGLREMDEQIEAVDQARERALRK